MKNLGDSLLVEINFDYETNCMQLDSLFDDVFFVKLETTEESLIGRISQILFTRDRIIVVDQDIAKNILVFDRSGKFLNSVGSIGQGPEEYTAIQHVALTPDSTMIAVKSYTQEIKLYTLDGKFVKNLKMKYNNYVFEFLSEQIIVLENSSGGNQIDENNPGYRPRLLVSDMSGQILYSAFQSYYKKSFTYTTTFPIQKYGQKVFYNPPYTDTVFCLTPEGIYSQYVFNMKGVVPPVMDENMTDKELKNFLNRYYYFNGEFIDLENSVYVRFWAARNPWGQFVLYSKKQEKAFCCNSSFSDPIFFFYDTPNTRYEDNYLVTNRYAYDIMNMQEDVYRWANTQSEEKRKPIEVLYKDLTEDDNPVLFFFRVNI
ncbi:MAG: 6-bladed beta-propeller [Tannerella sp.]|nr:6-bladed beta-propeller [Tannerella sp.]